MQHGHVSQQMLNSTVITPRHYFPRLLHLAVRKPSLILCLSHAKGLMLAALLLTLMLWPGQDVAVLQAVLLRCCIHCVILRVRILKLQLPVGNVPAGEKQQVPSRHSSFTLPVCVNIIMGCTSIDCCRCCQHAAASAEAVTAAGLSTWRLQESTSQSSELLPYG